MPTAEYDLRYLKAGIEQLENYLLSGEIYRPIGISASPRETPYPQLTLGGLLLARQRLRATAQSPAQQVELAHLEDEMDTTRQKWLTAWGRKAEAEFRARLRLWRNFIAEYRQEPAINEDRYAYEVSRRVMLQLLSRETHALPTAELELLNSLDKVLRAVLLPGDFVWDAVLVSSFPKAIYWYLYGQIKKVE